MAKKVQSMREKKATEDDRNSKKRQSREYRGRSSRHRQREAEKFDENPVVNQNREENPASNFALSPLLSERQAMNTSQEDQVMQDQMTTAMAQAMPSSRWTDSRKSPDKVSRDSGVTSPSEAGSVTTDCSDVNINNINNINNMVNQVNGFQHDSVESTTNILSVQSTPSNGLTVHNVPNNGLKVHNNPTIPQQTHTANFVQNPVMATGSRRPSDPLPHAPVHQKITNMTPVKAEIVTNELDDEHKANFKGDQNLMKTSHQNKKAIYLQVQLRVSHLLIILPQQCQSMPTISQICIDQVIHRNQRNIIMKTRFVSQKIRSRIYSHFSGVNSQKTPSKCFPRKKS